MRVLLVKTSSLGDVVHLLPAVADAAEKRSDVRFSWLVEQDFAAIPAAHPAVEHVVPVRFRSWRKAPFARETRQQWAAFRAAAKATQPDLVIDAQGLMKSALLARAVGAPVVGMDMGSAREPLASLAYQQRLPVAKGGHAVARLRRLLAKALDYRVDSVVPRASGLEAPLRPPANALADGPYMVFLHGTTWVNKFWPVAFWRELARQVTAAGIAVRLPWHGAEEKARANAIAEGIDRCVLLPPMGLDKLAPVVGCAAGVVGVDSGLTHLAAAYGVPGVALYGPTDPVLTGAWGVGLVNLGANFPCAPCLRRTCSFDGAPEVLAADGADQPVEPPCFASVGPDRVLQALMAQPGLAPLFGRVPTA